MFTMAMKATESIHAGCGKAGCVNTDRTDCVCPCLLKAHKGVQRGFDSVNFSTPHRFAVSCAALGKRYILLLFFKHAI